MGGRDGVTSPGAVDDNRRSGPASVQQGRHQTDTQTDRQFVHHIRIPVAKIRTSAKIVRNEQTTQHR